MCVCAMRACACVCVLGSVRLTFKVVKDLCLFLGKEFESFTPEQSSATLSRECLW